MVLEGIKYISEEEAKEMAYIAVSAYKIYKHPDVELRTTLGFSDWIKIGGWIFMMIYIWAPILSALVTDKAAFRSFSFIQIIIGLFIITILVSRWLLYPYYFGRKLYRKRIKNNGKISERTFIHLNEVGVFLKTDGNMTAGIYWDNVAFVRFFPRCIFFCPKGKRDLGVILIRYYEQPVREFLYNYHSEIPIY